MIILIGGSTHVGKTLVSQKLLEKYHFQCMSLDHLKMGFIRSGRTELTVNDDYDMRYWMWPFVSEIIKTAIENNQNLIIEGCYIPGEWAQSFSEDYLKHIRCVFIVMSQRYLEDRFDEVKDYACVIERRLPEKLDLKRLIMCSVNFKKDCEDNGFHCIEIDGAYDIQRLLDAVDSVVSDPAGTAKLQII